MSRGALDQTLEYIREVDRARTPVDVCAALLRAIKPFGFKNILAGTIPLPGSTKRQQEANVLLHEWPIGWWERYFSSGYLFVDPAIRRVTSDIRPFLWSELDPLCKDDPAASQVMNEADDFRLKSGFTVPMVTLDGEVAGFSLAGEKLDMPPHGRGMITLLATYALARTIRLGDMAKALRRITLSNREREALQWAAEGKTEWEIGMILGVSEHTAEKFLRTARAKLGAGNRTHAVAEAIRLGLIA
jgi:LuxR family quorum sensing-dependent transcriptional regulator